MVESQHHTDPVGAADAADRVESVVAVVNLHALTVAHDPARVRALTIGVATLLLAAGARRARERGAATVRRAKGGDRPAGRRRLTTLEPDRAAAPVEQRNVATETALAAGEQVLASVAKNGLGRVNTIEIEYVQACASPNRPGRATSSMTSARSRCPGPPRRETTS